MIQIVDYEGGFMAFLDSASKIAHRLVIPMTKLPTRPSFAFLGGPLTDRPEHTTIETEDLGRQNIEGFEFEGSRLKTILEDGHSVGATQERWISLEIGVVGLLKLDSPIAGESTSRIQTLKREQPDHELFVIPPDYQIEDSRY